MSIVGPTDELELELSSSSDDPELELGLAGDDPVGEDPEDEDTKGFESVLREALVRSSVNWP